MAYATVDELRKLLKQVPDTAEYNAELAGVLDVATLVIAAYMDFTFAGYTDGTTQDVLCRATSFWLELPVHRAGSITAVSEIAGRFASSETTVALTDWGAETAEGDRRLYREVKWLAGVWYRVTGDWGYGAVPDDVKRVCMEVAVNLWGGNDRRMFTDVIGVEGGGAVAYQRALTNIQRMTLDNAGKRAHGGFVVV